MPDVAATVDRLKNKPITFVGLNIDKDPAAAKALAAKHAWTWSQNYLGESSDMARQLAISSAPTYYPHRPRRPARRVGDRMVGDQNEAGSGAGRRR